MKHMIALAAAALLAASLGAPSDLMAQSKEPATPKMEQKPKTESGVQAIEGKVKSVDPSGTQVTLEDGTKLMIPKSVKAPKEALRPGALVMAQYEEKGGQKVVTSIQVKTPPQS
ncbi:MAG: DUF1344 domain-containing protein [Candidatus Rokubacteria bacterium]|nr:DUF1344 domain-containing protein [Candidatus Rokubacteria bacterium]